MNREQRLSIWTDDIAHPTSPTTRAAMEASSASMQLVEEWADLDDPDAEEEEVFCMSSFDWQTNKCELERIQ